MKKPKKPTLASYFNNGDTGQGLLSGLTVTPKVEQYVSDANTQYALPTMESGAYNTALADVMASPGQTNAAKAAYASQALDEATLRSRAGAQGQGALAQVMAGIAGRGGLNSTAGSRLGAKSLRDIMMAKQGVASQGARDRASILQNDVESQRNLAGTLAGVEAGRYSAQAGALNNRYATQLDAMTKAATTDASTMASGIDAGNTNATNLYNINAGIYGADKTADAITKIANSGNQVQVSTTPSHSPVTINTGGSLSGDGLSGPNTGTDSLLIPKKKNTYGGY